MAWKVQTNVLGSKLTYRDSFEGRSIENSVDVRSKLSDAGAAKRRAKNNQLLRSESDLEDGSKKELTRLPRSSQAAQRWRGNDPRN